MVSPKTWDRIIGNVEPVSTVLGTVLGDCFIIYAINYVLVCLRLEKAMEIGFKKWNKCLMSGLYTDSPLTLFWDYKKKTVLVCMKWIINVHVFWH